MTKNWERLPKSYKMQSLQTKISLILKNKFNLAIFFIPLTKQNF